MIERGEHIAEHVLKGEGNSDTADTETGKQRRYLDPEVIENDEQHDRPHNHGHRVPDRGDDRSGGLVRGEPPLAVGLEPRMETRADPDPDLDPPDDENRLSQPRVCRIGKVEIEAPRVHRGGEQDDEPRLLERVMDDVVPVRVGSLHERAEPIDDNEEQDPQAREHRGGDQKSVEPLARRVSGIRLIEEVHIDRLDSFLG